jgi:phage-related protein
LTSSGSKTRIKWEGDSQKTIRDWPNDVRQDVGLELHRLDNFEEALDRKPMGKSAPGINELRNEHLGVWYRLLYAHQGGWIYVLHCFNKKTNKTAPRDLTVARSRFNNVKARNDEPRRKEEEKNA